MKCKDCKQDKPDVRKRPDPYEEDVNKKRVIVTLCDECTEKRAEEI